MHRDKNKAVISPENRRRFSPFFHTMIGGKQESVTIGMFEKDIARYINSDISYMYENEKELREIYKARTTKTKNVVKLDMSKQTRGKAFDPAARRKQRDEHGEYLAAKVREVAEKRKRVEAAYLEKQKRAQAIEAAKAEARAELLAEIEAAKNAAADKTETAPDETIPAPEEIEKAKARTKPKKKTAKAIK